MDHAKPSFAKPRRALLVGGLVLLQVVPLCVQCLWLGSLKPHACRQNGLQSNDSKATRLKADLIPLLA